MKERVLVIGLDGATFDLIIPWMRQGMLPNLAEVIKNGSWSVLKSTVPTNSACAWASFMTGQNPGKHGVFDFVMAKPNYYDKEFVVNSSHVDGTTLWEILSKNGLKVGVINVPLTYPPRRVNGFLISGFLTPPSSGVFTYPPDLMERIKDYKIDVSFGESFFIPRYTTVDYYDFLSDQFDVTRKRTTIALRLMDDYDWDFFIVMFKGTDNIQHFFWHILDPKSPRPNPKEVERFGDLILEYYRSLDKAIGEILRKMDGNTTLIIMSDHGFAPIPTRDFNVNFWLSEIGLLEYKMGILDIALRWFSAYVGKFVATNAFLKLFRHVATYLFKKGEKGIRSSRFIDWTKTQAYQFCQGIRINLQGREPNGIVEPQKYEELRDSIIEQLSRFTDSETDRTIVKKVYKREAIYSGPYIERAPDIVIEFEEGYKFSWVTQNRLVTPSPKRRITGDHHIKGIFMACGPRIREGYESSEARIIDIAPTILQLLGVPIPSDLDGRVLRRIFKDESTLVERRIKHKEVSAKRENYDLSDEEKEVIKRRLIALGYITSKDARKQ